jgi:hypothetical protein
MRRLLMAWKRLGTHEKRKSGLFERENEQSLPQFQFLLLLIGEERKTVQPSRTFVVSRSFLVATRVESLKQALRHSIYSKGNFH